MDRRRFLSGTIAGLLGVPSLAAAQRGRRTHRIGFLTWLACPSEQSVFATALRELGYVWGRTIHVACLSGEGSHSRLVDAAAALTAQKVELIAALTHTAAFAAHRATRSVPIVMIASGDPVATGLVASLRRPGGNITGLTYYSTDLVMKRLQLLKEIVPGATRIAALGNPDSSHVFGLYRQDAQRAGASLGLELMMVDAREPRDLERQFDGMVRGGAQALIVLTDPMLSAEARRIADLAAQHRLPAMYWAKWFIDAGGLAAYSADYDDLVRRSAHYVDRILRGTNPSDLPIEQPTKFEFMVNMRAAKALGLTIAPSLLLRADQIIE